MVSEARRMAVARAAYDLQAEVELPLGEILGRQHRLDEAEASFVSARERCRFRGRRFQRGSGPSTALAWSR